MWALANIAGDSIEARDELIDAGLATQIVNIFTTPNISFGLLQVNCWAMSILCRDKPEPEYEKVKTFLIG